MQMISRNLFATSDDPKRLLIVLVAMMTSALLLGQQLYDPEAVQATAIVRLAGALGALFIWLLTFFMQPLVAASVYNAISTNSKSVKIAVTAIAIFATTTASAVAWASLVGKWLIPGLHQVDEQNACHRQEGQPDAAAILGDRHDGDGSTDCCRHVGARQEHC